MKLRRLQVLLFAIPSEAWMPAHRTALMLRKSPGASHGSDALTATTTLAVGQRDTNAGPQPSKTTRPTARATNTIGQEFRSMALPLLLVALSSPILSLIDVAAVGRSAGVLQLASLGPATAVCDLSMCMCFIDGRATSSLIDFSASLRHRRLRHPLYCDDAPRRRSASQG